MNLYEISSKYEQLKGAIEALGSDDLELKELAEKKLNELEGDLNEKAENICKLIQVWNSDKASIDAEIKRLQELKKTKVNSIDRLKEYLKLNLENANVKKLDLGLFKIGIRNNAGKVIIDDQEQLEKVYIIEEVVRKIDKKAIKEALKAGVVSGCHLEKTTSIMIK